MRYVGFAMLGVLFGSAVYGMVRDAVKSFGWKTVIETVGVALGLIAWVYIAVMFILGSK